jgi:hypothetical protein
MHKEKDYNGVVGVVKNSVYEIRSIIIIKKNRNTDLTIKRKGYKEVKSKITFFNILFQHLLRKHYIILILLEKYHYRMPILFRTMPIPSQDHQKLPGLSFSRRIKNYTMSTIF